MDTTTPGAPKADAAPDAERTAILASLEANPGALGDELGSVQEGGDHAPPDAASPEAVPGATPDPETKAETKAAAETAKPAEPAKEDRAKAEWDKINAEKARLALERQEFEQARSRKSPNGYNPDDYDKVAEQFAAEGQDDLAKQARGEATRLRQQAHTDRLTQAHTQALKELVQKYPDLSKPDSALYQRVDRTLRSRPVLFSYPEGMSDAVEACVAHVRGEKAEALEKEVGALKEALAAKEKLLHPTGGGPPVQTSGEDFDSLPLDQQRKRLMDAMLAADRQGVSLLQA